MNTSRLVIAPTRRTLFAAVLGYMVLGGVWHLSLVLKYHQRKPPQD